MVAGAERVVRRARTSSPPSNPMRTLLSRRTTRIAVAQTASRWPSNRCWRHWRNASGFTKRWVPFTYIRRLRSLWKTRCAVARGFLFCFLARQGTRGGAKEGHCGGEDGRPARPEASRRGYHYGRNVHGHVSALRAVPSRAREQPVQLGSRTLRFYAPHRIYALMF